MLSQNIRSVTSQLDRLFVFEHHVVVFVAKLLASLLLALSLALGFVGQILLLLFLTHQVQVGLVLRVRRLQVATVHRSRTNESETESFKMKVKVCIRSLLPEVSKSFSFGKCFGHFLPKSNKHKD